MTARPRRVAVPLLIALLTVILRVVAIVHVHALNQPPEENRIIARNLAAGEGFSFADFQYVGPTSIRPPLYPFLLAGLDRTFGIESKGASIAALALNVLAGAATVLFAFFLARPLFGSRLATVAAFALAVWPTQIYAATQFQGLSIGVALLLATLLLARRQWPIAYGIAAGLATLCESILLLPLLLVGAWTFRRKIDGLILMPLALLMVLLPWAYRNSLVRDRPTLVTNNFAVDLFRGNGPDATGSVHLSTIGSDGKPESEFDRLLPQQFDALRHQPEAQRDALLFGWAKSWIIAHPLQYARLCLIRVAKTFWTDWHHPLALNWINVVTRTLASGAALVCIIGAFSFPGRRFRFEPAFVLILLGLLLATMFTVAEARNTVLMDVPQLLLGLALFRSQPVSGT